MPYIELYEATKTLRRGKHQGELSHETFTKRLKDFKRVDIIGKRWPHEYYLTEKAYFLNRLKILYIGKPNKIFLEEEGKKRRGTGKEEIRYFSTNQEDSEQKIKI